MASVLPPGVKKPSASQQEISNHFSDTKATGMRCRSADEDLWKAEKKACVSHGSCVSWHTAGKLVSLQGESVLWRWVFLSLYIERITIALQVPRAEGLKCGGGVTSHPSLLYRLQMALG